jgi:hypothetical protein
MPMRFRYFNAKAPGPVVALGGRPARPRPLILVTAIGPSASMSDRGLLDTGADDTVFPDHWAATLGIDLSQSPTTTCKGVGGPGFLIRFAVVTLRVTDGVEFREWPATVGFVTGAVIRPLLGFAGFLQYFTATFRGDREEVELTANSLFPCP